jgi:23S rRNA (cytidine1920-2'-O)/16S rRNA (cytidine1409-2'-O)-methyltransferase
LKLVSLAELLVEKQLAGDIEEAKDLVENKKIWVAGFPVDNPSSLVQPEAHIEIKGIEKKWASRSGNKIWKFIEEGWIDPEGKICIDVGASTGGFTDALLRAGAKKIYAVDVGYGQLLYRLRRDKRVEVLDRYNFRYADPEDFQPPPEIFSMDVSFISTLKLVEPLNEVMSSSAEGLVLIKPQFEAAAEILEDGIVTDPTLRKHTVDRVVSGWQKKGWQCEKLSPAPLKGTTGNLEFIAKMSRQD